MGHLPRWQNNSPQSAHKMDPLNIDSYCNYKSQRDLPDKSIHGIPSSNFLSLLDSNHL